MFFERTKKSLKRLPGKKKKLDCKKHEKREENLD
jgi:hypothetical protein